jgi:hypothetical protein
MLAQCSLVGSVAKRSHVLTYEDKTRVWTAALYGKAKATIEQMATAVEDEVLRSTFLQSALVQAIHERAARLGE